MKQFFLQLSEKGIKLTVDEQGKLLVRGKLKALTTEEKDFLKNNKAQIIESILAHQKVPAVSPIVATKSEPHADTVLSFSQRRLWFIDKLNGGSSEYNMPMAFEVHGQLNIDRVELALNEIIQRHEVLRTVFYERDGEPCQTVLDNTSLTITVQDLSEQTDPHGTADAYLIRDAARTFNLSKDLMVRASYLQLTHDDSAVCQAILSFNMHHIASDGWSMDVLTKEFFAIYQALEQGTPGTLTPLPIQYRDFAHWQQQIFAGEGLNKQLDFWQQQLENVPALHQLPLDASRPAEKQYQGELVTAQLSGAIATQLLELARVFQLTPFMLLHGALALVLSRHSNTKDIVIGSPVANRQDPALAPLIGFFVNTLVFRVSTAHDTLSDYLGHVRAVHLGAQSNQDVPFEQLVEVLNVPRNNAYSPLFQILLTTDNHYGTASPDAQGTELGAATLQAMPEVALTTKFDLDIHMSMNEAGVSMGWTYDIALFSKAHISQLSQHLCNVLSALAELAKAGDWSARLAAIPMESEQEQQQALALGCGRVVDPKYPAVHQLLEHQAQVNPDAVAVETQGAQVTFAQLNARADVLATRLLTEHQVSMGQPVGIVAQRCVDTLCGIAAILKAGGTYVPLDPQAPADRLNYIVGELSLSLVLSHSLDTFAGMPCVRLDDPVLWQPPELPAELPEVAADNPAYILYTSGSTGRPKGVSQRHSTLVNLCMHQAYVDGITQPYRTLQFTPLTFDVSAQELATSWYTGSPLVLMSQQQKDQLQDLGTLVAKQNIERLFVPPAVFDLLAEQATQHPGIAMATLKQVCVAGDVLKITPSIRAFMAQHPQCDLYNHYGPTETHVATTYHVQNLNQEEVSIGQAIANTTCLILDAELAPVPVGCVGELYVAGPGVALGYYNNPSLTEARFLDTSQLQVPQTDITCVYKTGDLVRMTSQGNLQYLGRSDEQIKIRGFRVEPGEISAVLESCSEVESALVLATGEVDNKHLIAYVRPCITCETNETQQHLITALQAQLKDLLPAYMVPAAIVVVEQWPLTRNGKIDRRALPVIDLTQTQYQGEAPQTATEQTLAQLWSTLLGCDLDKLTRDADFFALGGHSLLSVRLVSLIRSEFEVEIAVKQVFSASTLLTMAALIESGTKATRPPIEPQERNTNRFALSYAQQRLWFIDQFQGSSAQYNMPMAFEIEGPFDLALAQQALTAIVARHEVLRTVYQEGQHGPEQVIMAVQPVVIRHLELSHLDGAHAQQLDQLLAEDAHAAFDLAADLMLRASYISLGSQRGVLLLNMHHIASDGWSLNLFREEFFTLYRAFSAGQDNPLPALKIQYADFAQWQRNWLQGEVLQQQLEYWQAQLSEAPGVHSIPLDSPRPADKQYDGAMVSGKASAQLATQLCDMAAHYQMTPFMLLHAVLALTISRYSNSLDVVIGTPVANRMQAEVEPLIGFFVNILALRVNTEQPSLDSYLQHVRAVHLDAQSHQDLPFEQLVDALQIPRGDAHAPLCQIMTSFNNAQTQSGSTQSAPDGLMITPVMQAGCVAKFDLEVEFSMSESGLQANWIYDTSLFTESHITQLSEHLMLLLERLVQTEMTQSLNNSPGQLSVLANEQSQYLVNALNDNYHDYDRSLCIHQAFEQQVARNPEHIALIFADQQLSYAQLNGRANQLAHYLRERGAIQSDTLIGVALERSLEMIVATLAVLKAGGAYVPLDPAYPPARLSYMLEDAGIKTIISSETISEAVRLSDYDLITVDGLLSDAALGPFSHCSDENPDSRAFGLLPTSLAYEIYTSGSTGQPKGVLLEHQGIVNLADNQRRAFAITPRSKILHFASMSFDAGTWEYAMALLNGATLVIAQSEQRRSPEAITALLAEQQISHVTLPPAFLAMMPLDTSLALQALIVAGEACEAELVNQWSAHYPFFNAYGPTEASVCASYQRLYPGAPITIGRPLNNVSLYVLDKQMNLVPPGVIGELHIGGDGLARGYHQRPLLSAEKFVDNPFYYCPAHRDSTRLYKTGDLARVLPDGSIDFVGRLDAQVKIRGFRIELSEIEAQLNRCPQLESAVVLVKQASNGVDMLVAYIQPHTEADNTTELIPSVEQGMYEQLPEYMVPSRFVVVMQWPLTPNGKIDKKALPDISAEDSEQPYVAPQTETELALAQIWSELLGIDPAMISSHARFFEQGGNSILVTRLETQIRHRFAVEFSIKELFAQPQLTEQALHIDYLLSRQSDLQPQDDTELEEMDW
ncbi:MULTISPECIES: non-ribosomal peptide synthetase [unclassified Pseudoalteromonas]|uniref:non-ribosomal peptide synthetase n=1 Tax=unclassified Pseudoalteromonas TaxID=194690 RepID=UPI0020976666|nr:non-ribosomal peptide synthetase [Pseudoalteromonas sp. XMcav2-N]MCO7187381.1 amino acid adenylation domain-containing protein [Pseudoalteromonas sp. XMcav2-N]